jgi:SAM-dependent methyltransferase
MRSYRRAALDAALGAALPCVSGRWLDLGGQHPPRGRFRLAGGPGSRHWAINLEGAAHPDVIGDGAALPFGDASVEGVLCLETLQYVLDPPGVVQECARVLRPAGWLVLSAPALHPFAPTGGDRHRFSQARLRELCASAGLRVARMEAQGAPFTTLAHLLLAATTPSPSYVRRALVRLVAGLLACLDRLPAVRVGTTLEPLTTGYLVVACRA